MTESLDRDHVIQLLDQLGSDHDEDVLKAARELHAQITNAGMDWDEVLLSDTAADPTEDRDVAAPSAGNNVNEGDTISLIEKLLSSPDRSEALREELEEYKTDIANGEFEARDHQYVRSLYERLTK
jgi:hypothetical protein